MSLWMVGIGVWMLQDGIASIAFYPSERWRWNHAIRLVRTLGGLVLIILGVLEA